MKNTFKVLIILTIAVFSLLLNSKGIIADNNNEWTGSVEQKIYGLMTVWAEAKFNFPFFDKRPGLNWDEKVKEYIPRVIETKDMDAYYKVLMEFAALLNDGHTGVFPPGYPFNPKLDMPPVELQVVENKFLVARTGENAEILKEKIYPGLEITEVDGAPIREYFANNVLRYQTLGTKQANDAILLCGILSGPKNTKIGLKVKDLDGKLRAITLTRNSLDKKGIPFLWQFMLCFLSEQPLETILNKDGILYVKIANFSNDQLPNQFQALFDKTDWAYVRGVIIDIRFNMGGSDSNAAPIVGYFIDQPAKTYIYKTLKYIPAYRSWNKKLEWQEGTFIGGQIEPREGKRYLGPLVILTGPGTYSTAEDFLVFFQNSGRVVLVGEKTAGSTGNPVIVPLPGGGIFRVVSLITLYPDGREFVGIGIQPDVEVHPTQEDIINSHDRVLTKGIEVIKNWEQYNKR